MSAEIRSLDNIFVPLFRTHLTAAGVWQKTRFLLTPAKICGRKNVFMKSSNCRYKRLNLQENLSCQHFLWISVWVSLPERGKCLSHKGFFICTICRQHFLFFKINWLACPLWASGKSQREHCIFTRCVHNSP